MHTTGKGNHVKPQCYLKWAGTKIFIYLFYLFDIRIFIFVVDMVRPHSLLGFVQSYNLLRVTNNMSIMWLTKHVHIKLHEITLNRNNGHLRCSRKWSYSINEDILFLKGIKVIWLNIVQVVMQCVLSELWVCLQQIDIRLPHLWQTGVLIQKERMTEKGEGCCQLVTVSKLRLRCAW